MYHLLRIVLLLWIVLFSTATANAVTTFVANLTIGQEPVPPFVNPTNSITGLPRATPFGTAVFVLNDAQNALTFTATIFNIDVNGLQTPNDPNDNLVAAHIHAGTGLTPTFGVVWGFFGNPFNNNNPADEVDTPFTTGVGGTFSGTWNAPEGNAGATLTNQLANIFAGRSYINFHTTQNPSGEIRGTLFIPEPSSALLFGLGLVGLASTLRRWA